MRMKIVVLVFSLYNFISFGISASEEDTLLGYFDEPPLITENLILNATQENIIIRYVRNSLDREHTIWKIKNENLEAIGFKIAILDIGLDKMDIEVRRDNCLFKDFIHDFEDGPLVHLGTELNIEFYKPFVRVEHGFEIEISSIYEGQESPCPGETHISMNWRSEHVVVMDSLDPEDRYGDYEHLWRITSVDPNAVGFKITFNNTKLNEWNDELKINGQECRYEFNFWNYNLVVQSQLPPLEVRGSWATVHLKLHSLHLDRYIYEDLIFSVDLLYESNKNDCSVCEFANVGDYCDGELCNCTAENSFCWEREHICACGEGSAYRNGECRSGYSCDDSNNCISFHGSNAIERRTRKTWSESKAYCEQEGARLVQITSEEFNDYVSSGDPMDLHGPYFIGFVYGGYQNWRDPGRQRGCPALMQSSKKWIKVSCREKFAFICEKVVT